MKVLRKTNRSGKRVQTIELEDHETLLVVNKNSFYKLGGQVNDVVASHVLTEMSRVSWCSVSQAWVD